VADLIIQIDTVTIGTIITSAPAVFWRWHVGPILPKEKAMPLDVTITTEEKVRIEVSPGTAAGNPAALDGAVTYTVTSGTCTLEAIDEISCFVVSGSTPGDSVISATGDADPGTGVVSLTDTCTVHVTDPLATTLGLSADAPVLKAPA
jgi:hypothetical protein